MKDLIEQLAIINLDFSLSGVSESLPFSLLFHIFKRQM